MNRTACLRLTERCADILISVREEIRDAGDIIDDDLAAPVSKLIEYVCPISTLRVNHFVGQLVLSRVQLDS